MSDGKDIKFFSLTITVLRYIVWLSQKKMLINEHLKYAGGYGLWMD